MEFIVRTATARDFENIIHLINEFALFQKTPDKVSITAAQMEADKALFNCIIAETEDKTMAGFATYFFAYYSWSGKALYLDDLYVKEQYRRCGIGKRLLMSVLDIGKASNCKKARWQVSNWNTSAISFYRSIGAAVDDVEINCDYHFTK